MFSKVPENGYRMWECQNPNFQPSGFPGQEDSYYILNAILLGSAQPDIYQYSFPGGHSGKFYINPKTGIPVLIDKKDSLIVQANSSNGWTIKTVNGNKFTFNEQETSYNNGYSTLAGRTWKLSRIDLNNGKLITYNYKLASNSGYSYSETYHDPYLLQPINPSDYGVVKHFDYPNSQSQMLSQIVTDKLIIDFDLEERLGIPATGGASSLPPSYLKSIKFTSKISGQLLNRFKFCYSYLIVPQILLILINRPVLVQLRYP